MGDASGDKKASIPEWQKNFVQRSPDDPVSDQSSATVSADSHDQSKLLEHAKAFLDDESIRNASRERKVAFLQKKGLQSDDIEKLLESQPTETAVVAEEVKSEPKIIHDSTVSTVTTQGDGPDTSGLSSSPPNRDIPPIITYPEFLLKPQKPPPLVTFQRLLNAAYAFAGLSALTYGASKFLVEPMLDSLTTARHEFADKTLNSLNELNSKLEPKVSHIPVTTGPTHPKRSHDGRDDEDIESIISDPTELFHRDVATQTSPPRSPSPSPESDSDDPFLTHQSGQSSHESKTIHHTTRQTARLASFKTLLTSLTSSTSTHFAADSLKESIADLQSLLDDLQLSQYQTGANTPYATDYSNLASTAGTVPRRDSGTWKPRKATTAGADGREREAIKFKSEIRALKGAFLSSRNFPLARPVRADGSMMAASTPNVVAGGSSSTGSK